MASVLGHHAKMLYAKALPFAALPYRARRWLGLVGLALSAFVLMLEGVLLGAAITGWEPWLGLSLWATAAVILTTQMPPKTCQCGHTSSTCGKGA